MLAVAVAKKEGGKTAVELEGRRAVRTLVVRKAARTVRKVKVVNMVRSAGRKAAAAMAEKSGAR